MKQQRLDAIEQYVQQKKSVTLDQLCADFHVSKNTVRRDIDALLSRGTLQKVYGGVTAVSPSEDFSRLLPFEDRHIANKEAKEEICRLAASFVQNGDTIYIDTGTTCANIVSYISDKTCTIITNSLHVCSLAVPYPNLQVIALPGQLKRETLSFIGTTTVSYLNIYNIGKAFMACTGCSLEHGLTNASAEEYVIKKAVIEHSQKHFLLADHSKFGKYSLMTYCQMADLHTIVSDQPLQEDYAAYCRENGISVLAP